MSKPNATMLIQNLDWKQPNSRRVKYTLIMIETSFVYTTFCLYCILNINVTEG